MNPVLSTNCLVILLIFANTVDSRWIKSLQLASRILKNSRKGYKPANTFGRRKKLKHLSNKKGLLPDKTSRKRLQQGALMGLGFEAASELTEYGFSSVKNDDIEHVVAIHNPAKKINQNTIDFITNTTIKARKMYSSVQKLKPNRKTSASTTAVNKIKISDLPSIEKKAERSTFELLQILGKRVIKKIAEWKVSIIAMGGSLIFLLLITITVLNIKTMNNRQVESENLPLVEC